MSEFKSALKPYDLDTSLAAECGDDRLVLDVGRDERGQPVASLQHVLDTVEHYIAQANDSVFSATKLYIVGEWKLTINQAQDEIDSNVEVTQERADATTKWAEATHKIQILIEHMGNLKELTWISGLPFTAAVWTSLPTTLIKLVVDLGEPVRLDQDGDILHKSYITSTEMKPLQEQTELKELRLFRIQDSLQPLLWETVFRNASETGMRVLDIQMANAPIVRSEQWKRAKDVVGLTVPTETSEEKEYKGMDGKGILHYSIGTGEYLDSLCIRKARIASGLDEVTPLPLWCLKLDGIVIDHLPFEHELSQIVLLTCGENCVDSGLRAPKSRNGHHNKWSRAVNNASSHCLIQWPNWTGIFDDRGDQRNELGVIVPQELGLSIHAEDFTSLPVVPLTEESLNLKNLDDALVIPRQSGHFPDSPLDPDTSVAETLIGAMPTVSARGSEVSNPTIASSMTGYSPTIPAIDQAAITPTTSFGSSDVSVANNKLPLFTLSTFEQANDSTS